MTGTGSWLEDLEAELDRRLERFLQANPEQEALLRDQAAREQRRRLQEQRLSLQTEAEGRRRALLRLAEEIRRWQQRVERARAAGATDLASRAEAHLVTLMEEGRRSWEALAELGRRFEAVEAELGSAAAAARQAARSAAPAGGADLESDWAAFEADQELQALRQRLQR